jgi:nitric oxide reductase NorE protein
MRVECTEHSSHDMKTFYQTASSEAWEPPGGVLVWLLVFLEVITFGAGIITFLAQGREHAAEFAAGRELLNQPLAFANTLLLLTGGWCMANGLGSLRCGNQGKSLRWVIAAILTGLVFTVLKGIEYAEKVQHGIGFGRDVFFTFYYALTGFHLVHVLAAVVLLAFMARGIRRGHYHREEHLDVESSGIFWHMCDLIWLLVYPVIYLL